MISGPPDPSRRQFLSASLATAVGLGRAGAAEDPLAGTRKRIDAHRPSKMAELPADLRGRIGTTLVRGKYWFTEKPNLIEAAEKMLELGTRLGKFWFEPSRAAADNAPNSGWPKVSTLKDLAATPYWNQVMELPFETLILIAHGNSEQGWEKEQGGDYYERVRVEYAELTRHLQRTHAARKLTVILQNWEGDWQLRGDFVPWDPPPADWRTRCERFAKRLQARQDGVARARAEAPAGCQLRVLHAAEVNKVTDQWKGIPTLTEHVLPQVELDLVSYSCYDAMKDGPTLLKAIETVRRFSRTGPMCGPGAVYLGEIGIPEMVAPDRIAERWDELIGAALAGGCRYIAQWQLYCNEWNPKLAPHPNEPVRDGKHLRGFWLIRPDGSLSECGRFFTGLWARCAAGPQPAKGP
jgi:hypothetical protein